MFDGLKFGLSPFDTPSPLMYLASSVSSLVVQNWAFQAPHLPNMCVFPHSVVLVVFGSLLAAAPPP
jgi:hypothetical protein